jgi:hypothetical protein
MRPTPPTEPATARNRHPADELADIREQIRQLRQREAELRGTLLGGRHDLVGDDYIVAVYDRLQRRIDLAAARQHFGEQLKPFEVEKQITLLMCRPKP